MSPAKPDEPAAGLAATELVHPIYLDVPMLVSFLAALEGGVSFEDQATLRSGGSASREREGKAGAGVRVPVLPSILSLDISGRIKAASQTDESQEIVAVRRHTEASLFNLLRSLLHSRDAVISLDGPQSLAPAQLGELVEIAGEVVGNPLEQLYALLVQTSNLAGIDLDSLLKPPPRAGKSRSSGGQSKAVQVSSSGAMQWDENAVSGLRQFLGLVKEVLNAQVRDYVMETDVGVSAVLTLASEFITAQAAEYLRGSRLRVIGKVTRVVTEDDEPINLTRRSSLGIFSNESTGELFANMVSSLEGPLGASIANPLVRPPAVQLLPLAIFV